MNIKTLDQFKNTHYGVKGTKERDRIERELEALRIGLKLRTAREQQKLTQNELAQRINKKRTFISKVENDGENMDSVCFKVIASKELDLDELRYKSLYIVFLTNVGSNRKIWSALRMTSGNVKLCKQILCNSDDLVSNLM